jgi:ribonuclease BN (tRNA processing enzyme)
MKITVLGSAAGFPVAHRSHTSIAIEHSNHLVLLDAGEGTSRSLVTLGFDCKRIEKVLISHTHPDHVMGLPMLLTMMYLDRRGEPLDIYFPKAHVTIFQQLLEHMYLPSEKLPFALKFIPIDEAVVQVGEALSVQCFPTEHLSKADNYRKRHGTSSYGYLVMEGAKRVVFSSDIRSVDDLRSYSQNLDLLIVESTHVDLDDVIRLIKENDIKQIIITHIPPELEERIEMLTQRAHENGVKNLRFAHDGLMTVI